MAARGVPEPFIASKKVSAPGYSAGLMRRRGRADLGLGHGDGSHVDHPTHG